MASQWEPALDDLLCIYVLPPDCARKKSLRAYGWSRGNLEAYFAKIVLKATGPEATMAC